MRPILSMKYNNQGLGGGKCEVWINNNGTLTKLGDSFGYAPESRDGRYEGIGFMNRVAHWRNALWCQDRYTLYQYPIDSGFWRSKGSLGSVPSYARKFRTGLFPVQIGGEPHLVGLNNAQDADGARAVIVDEDENVTFGEIRSYAYITDQQDPGFIHPTVFNNKIYGILRYNLIMSYDPNTDTYEQIWYYGADHTDYPRAAGMCAHDGNLYILYRKSSDGSLTLGRIDGTTVTSMHTGETTFASDQEDIYMLLFSHGDYMYGLARMDHASYDGWRCYRYEVTPTGIVRTNHDNLVPELVRYGISNSSTTSDCWSYYTSQEDGEEEITIQLQRYRTITSPLSVNYYSFSPSSTWEFLGAGSTFWSVAHSCGGYGGGTGSFAGSGEYNIELGVNSINTTTIDIDFYVHGPATGIYGPAVADFKFSTVKGDIADRQCTIDSVIDGPGVASGLYHITGLNTDGSKNTFRWRAGADGVGAGKSVKLVGRIANWSL